MVPSPGENNTTPTGDQAAAADPTLFDTDPLQPGEIHLHLWMLYMSWPENQGILFFYISQTLQMNRISIMASLLNAVL